MPIIAENGRLRPGLLIRLLALLGCFLISGCAGTYQPMGPAHTMPALAAERLTLADGLSVPLRRWAPAEGVRPRAVILALHGFNDYGNAFALPGRYWAGQGIVTLAYDQRGFGDTPNRGIWPGIPTLGADLSAAIAAVRAAYPDLPLYVLGESMGGAVVASRFAGQPLPEGVAGLILSAPAVWSRSTMPFYQRWALALAGWTVPWMELTPPRGLKIQASDNIPMLVALGRDPLMIRATRVDAVRGLTDLMDQAMAAMGHLPGPTLVMYGQHEQVIPPVPVAQALASLPADASIRRVRYPQGWHMLLRDLQAETVWRDVAAFVGDPAAPLPSGLEGTGTGAPAS
ncbi:alpha/beta fold hydrolase [Niveispirillum sp. BGYR6]|uniref:alpha/beta fold hydrolase n=1 Tax=Niveispirillum sp. BGYR6 TaxID=2971249 RepID=UPI0022B94F9C|nr:alpha/beta fold hydrolase [Niveispirillum sp. BGYR6]MDG5495417.1 alpha/beta fold hydrolase [Niveispirillum sp. BGYR6]